MARFTLEETAGGDFLTLPEETVIQVAVETVEEREVPGRDGNPGWTKLSFRFKVLELPTALEAEYGVLIGTPIFGSVSARFTSHPDNKLRQWSEALLNIGELDPGFELDTDMLIGRKARAVTNTYKKKDGTLNHQVKGLLPLTPVSVVAQSSFGFDGTDELPPF